MVMAVAYGRYSSDEQTDNSIDMQFSAIREFAAKSNFEIVKFYSDAAQTGRDDDREEFIQMYNDLKSGAAKAEVVLLYKMSRLFRNVYLWQVYESRFEALGVRFISVTEPILEECPMAKLQKLMMRGFDEFTSDNTGLLALDGAKQIVRRGFWPGGPAPFGFKNIRVLDQKGDERGNIVPDERESKIVKRIFEIAAETGKGGVLIYKQICEEFGGPVLGRKGQELGAGGVNSILRNPIYTGKFIYNDFGFKQVLGDLSIDGGSTKNKRERKPEQKWVIQQNESWRLIDDALWAKVQSIREQNRQYRPGFGRRDKCASYALTGLITCGVCGNICGGKWQSSKNATFSENSKYYYYRCRCAMNGDGRCSNKAKIRGRELEVAVVEKLLSEVLDERLVCDIAREVLELQNRAANEVIDRASLEKREQELLQQQGRLIELAAKVGEIAAMAEKINECQRELRQIEVRLKDAPKVQTNIEELKRTVRTKLQNVRDLLSSDLNKDDLRCLLQKWVDGIRIDGDGKVYIRWNANAVYELLEVHSENVQVDVSGNPPTSFRIQPSLESWHPVSLATENCRARIRISTAPALKSGCSGFSGFSGIAQPAQIAESCQANIGFSGFSGQSAA